MQYSLVDITCYCGAKHTAKVGQKVKCGCGVTLCTQQKAHGTGKVWGEADKDKAKEITCLVQSGKSQLDAQFRF